MNVPRSIVALVALVAILAASGSGYLISQIDRTNATLLATETTLRTTQADLRTTRADLGDRTVTLNAAKVSLARSNAAFIEEREVRNQLQVDKTALGASLHTATAENTALTASLVTATEDQQQLRTDLDAAAALTASLRSAKIDVETRHRELEAAVGSVEGLETRADELLAEIDDLFERRRPLILAKQSENVSGFRCTGSMEPVITCLDTATWVEDFAPDDIVVGATISFANAACWPDAGTNRSTAHRVLDIRVTGGVTHYWPRGDANAEPDSCWVPHSAVDGYIIAIHRNTNLENTELRDKVNAADARYASARAARVAAWATYLAEKDAYVALRVRHGCSGDVTANCYADGAALAELVQAFESYRRVIDVYRNAVRVEERAASFYECWYGNAQESLYPGHIPNPCNRVVPLPPPPPP